MTVLGFEPRLPQAFDGRTIMAGRTGFEPVDYSRDRGVNTQAFPRPIIMIRPANLSRIYRSGHESGHYGRILV